MGRRGPDGTLETPFVSQGAQLPAGPDGVADNYEYNDRREYQTGTMKTDRNGAVGVLGQEATTGDSVSK